MTVTVAIVGVGDAGWTLIQAFGRVGPTIAFGFDEARFPQGGELREPLGPGLATNKPTGGVQVRQARDAAELTLADFIIVAVPPSPRPSRAPDLGSLLAVSRAIGPFLRQGVTVIYESTVYPGATEDVCVPALEHASGLKWKQGFFVGYSPARANQGDSEHTLANMVKVVAGDTPATLEKVAALYGRVVAAGVHRTTSIKAAEACKVIENAQRDLNIALMNELAIIFGKIGVDTAEVLDAAGTKWNFLKFKPGLVGGHCVGVDPYYLTHKAETLGYHPQVILAGRRINDGMGKYIAEQTVKQMIVAGSQIQGAKVNVLGLSYKENHADLRNSKVIDIIRELQRFGAEVFVHDPEADPDSAWQEHRVRLVAWDELPRADAVVAAVAHQSFLALSLDALSAKLNDGACFIDVKAAFDPSALRGRGWRVWRL